jgi:hypothetical protein
MGNGKIIGLVGFCKKIARDSPFYRLVVKMKVKGCGNGRRAKGAPPCDVKRGIW